jgi:hypothetical protein
MTTYPEVIGIGLPRTGLWSLEAALDVLGYNRPLTMDQVANDPVAARAWLDRGPGGSHEHLAGLVSGYDSIIGLPASRYWRDLSIVFPEAKFVLTVRDLDEWWDSFSQTIGALEDRARALTDPGTMLAVSGLFDGIFRGEAKDEDYAKMIHQDHIMEVIHVLPQERLLVLDSELHGWEPLCEFLSKPVPEGDYPHMNLGETYQKAHGICTT